MGSFCPPLRVGERLNNNHLLFTQRATVNLLGVRSGPRSKRALIPLQNSYPSWEDQ